MSDFERLILAQLASINERLDHLGVPKADVPDLVTQIRTKGIAAVKAEQHRKLAGGKR